jgi:hypothetical protein
MVVALAQPAFEIHEDHVVRHGSPFCLDITAGGIAAALRNDGSLHLL